MQHSCGTRCCGLAASTLQLLFASFSLASACIASVRGLGFVHVQTLPYIMLPRATLFAQPLCFFVSLHPVSWLMLGSPTLILYQGRHVCRDLTGVCVQALVCVALRPLPLP